MKAGTRLNYLNWKNVAVEGIPITGITGNFEGFVGLEECTDYGFDTNSKQSKKKIKQKKTLRTESTKNLRPVEKNLQIPFKKLKLSNGFLIEQCEQAVPSLTNESENNLGPINENIPKKSDVIINKKKLKLGETELKNEHSKLTIEDMQSWTHFQIPEEILKALAEQGFKTPTKIQELTLPSAMLGRRDILGAAETGSGKTLAFGIPILYGIMKLKEKHLAGEDVYDMRYKKSSAKKKSVQIQNGTKKKVSLKRTLENDSDEETDMKDEDQNSTDEFIEETEVPIRRRTDRNSADEQNDSDDSDDYLHLSELLDSDEDVNDEVSNDGTHDEPGESDDRQSFSDAEGEDIGCIKVIDDIELPSHVVQKTGKPLYALILTPTRELAMQVSRHLMAAAKYTGIKIATLVGGMAHVKQERVLSRGPEVVVATPGRLWELMQQGQTHLQQMEHVKFLAIDETDRMMERNHFEELHPLLEKLNSDERRKTSRQNFVFSATLTLVHDLPDHMRAKKVTKRGKIINRKIEKMTPQQKIKKLVDMIGMTDPKVVDITTMNLGAAETLTECRIVCSLEEKDYYLHYILKRHPGRTIVFCNSIGSVKRLSQLFGLLNCRPLPLHASMPQRQRLKNIERFRDDRWGVLVATDVAARGLDIPDVDHVVHYQVPRTAENYVHRSGRTARASKEGLTILMMEPGEAHLYGKLCRTLNKKSELPMFPVPAQVLSCMRDVVTLARDVDRLQLRHRRSAQEQGWLDKAAHDMDLLIDEDFLPRKNTDATLGRTLQVKKRQLDALLAKPMFPRGFSFKYPTLNDPDALLPKCEENALQVMKNALVSGELKKEKRKSKNASLLKLQKKFNK